LIPKTRKVLLGSTMTLPSEPGPALPLGAYSIVPRAGTGRTLNGSVRHRRSGPGIALSVLAFCGCNVGTDPGDLSAQLVRRPAPAPIEYSLWWSEISQCSGRSGDLLAVRFLVVVSPLNRTGTSFPCGGGFQCNGIWEAPHDITLAPAHFASQVLVKHEMLHDLLQATGHPPVFEQCGVAWGNAAKDLVPRESEIGADREHR
jgi:hypothetical protein